MSRISGLRVTNWKRFAGEHTLELEPTVYAVVAQHARDERRSNWLGKSSLLEAIRFALFGTLPSRTKDEVIFHGAPMVVVELELDDSTFVQRRFRRGKPVELFAAWIEDGHEVTVAEQKLLIERLGFDEPTFMSSCYFEQKSMSRFITADPAERSRLVNEWLDLAPVQKAHGFVGTALASIERNIVELNGQLKVAVDAMLDTVQLTALRVKVDADAQRLLTLDASIKVAVLREADAKNRDRVEEIDDRLRKLQSEELPTVTQRMLVVAGNRLSDAASDLAVARANDRTAKDNASRGFDGVCPVTCKACPITEEINIERDAMRRHADDAAAELSIAIEKNIAAGTHKRSLDDAFAKHQATAALLEERTKLIAGFVDIEEGVTVASLEETRDDLRDAHFADQQRLDRHERGKASMLAIEEKLVALRKQREAHELAVRVLGRNGVQRKLATEFIEYLQDRATARLQEAGIDLSVRLYWGKETQQRAEACDECGTAFARSAKEVRCTKCGSKRGMKRDDKLYIEPSDRSGAADDLAGIAVQLAAAEWIRAARGVEWSTIILDEPFGALDESNRASLASVLMHLASDGFEQALIVAHDRGTLDAMPGRIVVNADDKASSVRVVR